MPALAFRFVLLCINILFPPLTVMILCGPGMDFMLSCCFFILGVIPSHVQGFYISQTYFHRRRKVRKGIYPGGPKALIYSDYVINGGASPSQVKKLYNAQFAPQQQQQQLSQRRRSRSGSVRGVQQQQQQRQRSLSRPGSRPVSMVQVSSNLQRVPSGAGSVRSAYRGQQRESVYGGRGRI